VTHRANYLLLPDYHALNFACRPISRLGYGCFLVGSCLERADFRDVDVRTILSDEQWAAWFPEADPEHPARDPLWAFLCVSVSFHLQRCSGLPIDYQIQQQSTANAAYPGRRSALGLGLK